MAWLFLRIVQWLDTIFCKAMQGMHWPKSTYYPSWNRLKAKGNIQCIGCVYYAHSDSNSMCEVCWVIIWSWWYVTEYVYSMWDVHYVSLYRMILKFVLRTSFPTACPSTSDIVGLHGWSRVKHMNLISNLNSRVYVSIRRYKRIN